MMRLAYQDRKQRRRPLLFIADISGSMERYSEMLLYFAHAARDRLGRMEAFVFATHLTRITRQLERRDASLAIQQVSRAVTDWSSGTQIGEALATFNRSWSRRVGRGGPIAIIVSDGWDRGDPALLATEMARLHRSVHRVVWLNPLASREGYQPLTKGMQAALPFIDDFLPVGNFVNLQKVVQALESVPLIFASVRIVKARTRASSAVARRGQTGRNGHGGPRLGFGATSGRITLPHVLGGGHGRIGVWWLCRE